MKAQLFKTGFLRASITSLIAVALFCWHASPAQAISYNLIDGGGGNQGGHTLEGFIEFDSACGANCTAANVTDFTFSVSGPSVYSYSYQSAADVILDPGQPGQPFLIAGPQYLSVDYHEGGTLILGNSTEGSPYIEWAVIGPNATTVYASQGPGFSGGWGGSPFLVNPIQVAIGIVPEPRTATTVLLTVYLLYTAKTRFD